MLHEILQTALHSIISVSTLFILARLMGKKQIAQLTFFDYVIGISIGSIAAQGAVDPAIHFTEGMTGLLVFALFSIILSFISTKSYIGRKLLDGTPTVLIENGKVLESGLKKSKLNVNDLLEECRQKNVFDLAEINLAILETNGKLSILLNPANLPLTVKDMNITPNHKGLCTNVIIDGKILDNHLSMANQDVNWLKNEMMKQNVTNASEVLLAYIDSTGNLNIHLRNVNPTITSIL